MRMEKIRVLLVDDQVLFVENLRFVLQARTDDIEVTAIAHDGAEAVACVEAVRPDIVLMDVRMPVMDGVEAARRIHEAHPDVRIVMLTTFDNDDWVHQALRCGAVGYLLKQIPPEELFAAIRSVRLGTVLISPSVAKNLVAEGCGGTSRGLYDSLTPREREIIRLISQAYGNKQIADRLHIAEQTVKNYLSVLYSKLGIGKRTELVRLFRGMTDGDGPGGGSGKGP